MLKKISLYLVLVIVALVFILSAYLKLYPIETFEYSFVDAGVSNWRLAPIFARLFIGLEFLTGVLLLMNLRLEKFTYKFCIYLLSFFVLYLTYQLIVNGNKGNCGCFGQAIEITPLQALIKNILLIGLILVLRKHLKEINYGKHARDIFFTVIVASFTVPFVLNPLNFEYTETYLNKPKEGFNLDLEVLYDNAKLNSPPKSLSKGKHVISFVSLTCPHCRIAIKKMRIIHDRHPEISFYFVLNGKDEELQPFFDDTRSEEIPHCMLLGKPFISLAGLELPVIYLVNDSKVEYSIDYFDLSEDAILDWVEK